MNIMYWDFKLESVLFFLKFVFWYGSVNYKIGWILFCEDLFCMKFLKIFLFLEDMGLLDIIWLLGLIYELLCWMK